MKCCLVAYAIALLLAPSTQPAALALRSLLPAEVAGLKQISAEARTSDGTNVAVASYSNADSTHQIAVICTQFVDAETASTVHEWFARDINEKANGTTRRTATIGEYRSLEEHKEKSRSGTVSIRLNDRTVLALIYSGVDEADGIIAAQKLPLAELSTIK